jgi:hypothetical protein
LSLIALSTLLVVLASESMFLFEAFFVGKLDFQWINLVPYQTKIGFIHNDRKASINFEGLVGN